MKIENCKLKIGDGCGNPRWKPSSNGKSIDLLAAVKPAPRQGGKTTEQTQARTNFQFSVFNLQSPREQTRAQNAPNGPAALGRNQKHLLHIIVVTLLTLASYGEWLEIFVKFLTIFEVSSTGKSSNV